MRIIDYDRFNQFMKDKNLTFKIKEKKNETLLFIKGPTNSVLIGFNPGMQIVTINDDYNAVAIFTEDYKKYESEDLYDNVIYEINFLV